jgi:hypothetical protein
MGNKCKDGRNVFRVYGPFELAFVKGSRLLDSEESARRIAEDIGRRYSCDNLERKGGCYIFAIRTGGRGKKGGHFVPWYVGKAKKQPLLKESLNHRNFNQFYSKVAMNEHGRPMLFWIAKAAPGHVAALNANELRLMERELIAYAFECNPGLKNSHHRARLTFKIEGLPLSGQDHPRERSGPAKQLAAMLLGS